MTHILSSLKAGAAAMLRAASSPVGRLVIVLTGMVVAALWQRHDLLIAAPFAAGVLTEGMHTGEFLLSEAPGTRSRDNVTVTVPGSTTLAAGYVLARLTATGKYVPYDNAGSDGSESAYGVLWAELVNDDGSPVDMDGVVINTDAEIVSDALTWHADNDAADQAAGLADLLSRGIKAR